MSYLRRPHAVVTLDGRALTAAEAGLVELEVTSGLGELGEARLVLWPRSRLAGATPGSSLTLELGARDGATLVFTGTIERVVREPAALVLEALEPTVALHRRFLSRAYLNQTVAGIVRDLADPVAVSAADADLELGLYRVENRQSVWWHLRELATLAGCDLGATAGGELLFRPRGRGDVRRFRYGADLLAFSEGESVVDGAPGVAAHGSASSRGNDRWHWLNPDPLGSTPTPARVRGAIANDAAAAGAGAAASARIKARARCGTIMLWARPEVRPGDGIELEGLLGAGTGLLAGAAEVSGLPLAGGGGATFRARRVRHAFGRESGFITTVELEGGAAPDGGGGPLGGLP